MKVQVFGDLGAQASLDISLRQQADMLDNFTKTISQLQVRTQLVDSSLGIINLAALQVQNLAFQTPSQPTQRQEVVSPAEPPPRAHAARPAAPAPLLPDIPLATPTRIVS